MFSFLEKEVILLTCSGLIHGRISEAHGDAPGMAAQGRKTIYCALIKRARTVLERL